jgi:hypothetical protein
MRRLLTSLGISEAGFHAFRHFNVSLLDALRVPLKTIQERIGHAFTGSFTLDVYGGQPEWNENLDAARKAGAALADAVEKFKKAEAEAVTRDPQPGEKAANFVSLTAINENGLQTQNL